MEITVKIAGYFKKYLKTQEDILKVNLDGQSTLKDLFARLDIDLHKVKSKPIILVNGRQKRINYNLQNGDEVIIMTLIGGG